MLNLYIGSSQGVPMTDRIRDRTPLRIKTNEERGLDFQRNLVHLF